MERTLAQPDEGQARRRPWRRLLRPAILFILVVGLYGRSASNDFVYDDIVLIVDQAAPRSVWGVFEVFGERHWYNLPYYRPVCRLTMVGQKFVHGDQPGAYHLFNAVLMGIASGVAYALLRRPALGIRPLPALLGAALFALHPIASCTVYPICSGRESLMPAVFSIAAVYAFLRSGRWWYFLAMLMLVASLLSKEQAVIVPGLFLVADALGLSSDGPGRRLGAWLRRYAPVAVIVPAYILIRLYLFAGSGLSSVAVFDRPWGPLFSGLYALQTTFVPFAELVYEPKLAVWISGWRQVVALVPVFLLAVGAWRHWPAVRRSVLFWLGWFVLALLPTANLVDQEARFAERYGFLALLGVIGIGGVVASAGWSRLTVRRWTAGLGLVLVVACAATSLRRNVYFADNRTFLNQWLHTDPQSVQALTSLGEECYRAGKLDEAVGHFRQALGVEPDLAKAHSQLGNALFAQGKREEALRHHRLAVAIDPDSGVAYSNLGVVLAAMGEWDDAIEHYETALRVQPDLAEAHINLGEALWAKGKHAEAIARYGMAVRADPGCAAAHLTLGAALQRRGEIDEAIQHYDEVLRIDPSSMEARANLGSALLSQPDYRRAIEHFTETLRMRPRSVRAHYSLAEAFRAQGRLDEAIGEYREVLRINPNHAKARQALNRALAQQKR
ncbi:MAG: tetratricopeptide repeat protein, partial [Planctomycetota bacterium]